MLILSFIFGDERLFFNQLILITALILQVAEIIRFIHKTNRELARFFVALKQSDYSVAFSEVDKKGSFKELYNAFEGIVNSFEKVKIEREAQFLFLMHLVEQVPVGIISVSEKKEIALLNNIGKSILGLSDIRSWKSLETKLPEFTSLIERLGNEGKSLIEIEIKGEKKSLSIEIASLKIMGDNHLVITLQDIKNQIEQKEIEAWNRLIKILTHEIMNSITPVSSLTETMKMVLEKNLNSDSNGMDKQTAEDLLFSVNTIQKRSEGMLEFVEDYRKLTKVPNPKFQNIKIIKLLERSVKLMEAELLNNNVTIELKGVNPEMEINLDPALTEQIIINLFTNAFYALKNITAPKIQISTSESGTFKKISFTDNGHGIDPDIKDEIFIPFFSTKDQGSGIGLSLSKQIMYLHNGNIKADSDFKTGGSTFILEFRNNVKIE